MKETTTVDKVKKFITELLFPSFCLGCKKEGTYLCQDCTSTLDISEHTYCLCSKGPLRISNNSKTGKCYSCKDKKLSGLYSALPYQEKLLTRQLIYQFKYEPYIKTLAQPLASILVEHFVVTSKNSNELWDNGILIPIPLEKKKLKSRGYNQAEELAKELSLILKIPVVTDVLLKTKETKSQMKLSKKERKINLRDAFIIKNQAEIAGKKVFLVDDVYTTGSTMEECANVLRTFGVKEVWGIVIAREG